MTAQQLVQRACDLGIAVVQLADNLPLHSLDSAVLERLQQFAAQHRVTLELGTCGIAVPHLLTYLSLAEYLGARLLRVVPDAPGEHPSPADLVEALGAVAADFERAQVRIAVENHDRFPARTLRQVMESVSSSHVGICLDTANSLGCGEGLETVVRELGPWVVNLHVKDFHVERLPHGKGFIVEGRPAGQGLLDIPHLLNTLVHCGDISAILELWPPPAATIAASIAREEEWARQSIVYLRRLIEE